jgi:hypothetical protein
MVIVGVCAAASSPHPPAQAFAFTSPVQFLVDKETELAAIVVVKQAETRWVILPDGDRLPLVIVDCEMEEILWGSKGWPVGTTQSVVQYDYSDMLVVPIAPPAIEGRRYVLWASAPTKHGDIPRVAPWAAHPQGFLQVRGAGDDAFVFWNAKGYFVKAMRDALASGRRLPLDQIVDPTLRLRVAEQRRRDEDLRSEAGRAAPEVRQSGQRADGRAASDDTSRDSKPTEAEVAELIADSDPSRRAVGLAAAGRQKMDAFYAKVLDAALNGAGSDKGAALDALGFYERDLPEETLRRLVAIEDPEVRLAAIELATRKEPARFARETVDLVRALVAQVAKAKPADRDREVLDYLPRLVCRLARGPLPQALLEGLKDPSPAVRRIVVQALALSGNTEAVLVLQSVATSDTDRHTRAAVKAALLVLGPVDSQLAVPH